MDDEELVAAMPYLRGYALKLSHHRDYAEDLVQDTMVRALRNRSSYTPGTKLRCWLAQILFRIFIDNYRRGRLVHGDIERFPPQFFAVPPAQPAVLMLRELETGRSGLSESQRQAVILAGLGYTLEESAAAAGVPVGTMRSRVHYGRAKLMEAAA